MASQKDIYFFPPNISLLNFIIKFLGWTSLSVLAPIIIAKITYKALVSIRQNVRDTNALRNKVVLITGASSGLGETLAYNFQNRGCQLILCSRNEPKLQELKKTLINTCKKSNDSVPQIVALDLEDLNSIPSIIQNILKTNGHIDILINNAGVSYRGNVSSTNLAVDIKLMNVNYFGHVAVTKAILPSMIERQRGHIISIGSIQSKLPLPHRSCYAASKHALQAFMDCLRAEVCHKNIHVLMVNPSYIDTNISYNAITESGKLYGVKDKATSEGMSPFDVAEEVIQSLLARKNEVTIGSLVQKAALWLRAIMPDLYFYIMKLRASSSLE